MTKSVVLCLGDSHTYGFFGGAWVRRLSAALPGTRFVNKGVNGTQTINVNASQRRILQSLETENLMAVTLLIGTNDCLLSLAEDRQDARAQHYYRSMNGFKGPANVEVFKEHFQSLMTDLTEQLRQRTTTAARPIKLLVMTLPPIGEAFNEPSNKKVDEHNDVIRQVVQQQQQQQDGGSAALDVVLLDLHALCKAAIETKFASQLVTTGTTAGATAAGTTSGSDGHSTTPAPALTAPRTLAASFWGSGLSVAACAFRRHVMFRSYDQQSQLAGTVVLTPDCIHLNDTGAELVRGLVEQQLRSLMTAPGST